MKYKMVCVDVDGTLLTKTKKICKDSREKLIEADKLGIKVVITTGRLHENANSIAKEIGLTTGGVISGNGALVMEQDEEKVIYQSPLPIECCKELISLVNNRRITYHFHTKDRVICNNHYSRIIARAMFMKNKTDIIVETIKDKGSLIRRLEGLKEEVFKCILISPYEKDLVNLRKELNKLHGVNIYNMGRSIEVNGANVSKGKGVEELAKYYGIKREEIICIGDNENDISMIEYAGVGVAMGNGVKELKERADYITSDNSNAGVGKVIEKYILSKE